MNCVRIFFDLLVFSLFFTIVKAAELTGLPFPYYLSFKYKVKAKKIPFVPENTYTLLNTGDWAMIGPLLPCQCLIFIYEGKIFLAHLTFNSSYTDLCNKIKQQIPSSYNPTQIKVMLFTNKSWLYSTRCEQSNGLVTSWEEIYDGESQQDVLEKIKNHIIKSFLLKANQVNIKTNTWNGYNYSAIYPLACLYLVIRNTSRGLLINNICPTNVIKYFNSKYNNNTIINDQIYQERQYIKRCLEYPNNILPDNKNPLLKVNKSTYFSFALDE